MKIHAKDIRNGNVIEHNRYLWMVVRYNTVKPGKGGAFTQVELKKMLDGSKLHERFRSEQLLEKVRLEQKDFSFLYQKDDLIFLMNLESYEQISIKKDFFGNRSSFLKNGIIVTLEFYKKEVINVFFPNHISLKVISSDPVIKGQNASSSYKPAILENGLRILVPLFIEAGEKIIVDTNEVVYLRRSD